MIVFAVLTTVMALPLVGLVFFRLYENELVRQTETELIGQSAVLAAIFTQEAEALPNTVLGAPIVHEHIDLPDSPYRPVTATLDLSDAEVLGRRPDAAPAPLPPSSEFLAVGAQLQEIALRTQIVTLAGFRILDPQGVVIAGREERGLSLAHIDEVAEALKGRYRSALRMRAVDQPSPPLYSLSRGTQVRVFAAMPVFVGDRVAGVIYASRTPNNILRSVYGERRKFVIAGLTLLGATLAIGFLFSRIITGPIHALVARTVEIGRGNRAALRPLAHHGTREIALLAGSFIEMAERLHERSDYIATFAAHVSHELKSPLTAIRGAAELLADEAGAVPGSMSQAERTRFLQNIITDTKRLTAMLHRLRELSRAESQPTDGKTSLVPIVEALRRSFPMLSVRADGRSGEAVAMSAENAIIVFSHLADNSVRHHATELVLHVSRQADEVRIEVRDNGNGIPRAVRDKIFDAFFTTRREHGGTGMGLAIVAALLRAHHGSIRMLEATQGAVFEVRLPTAP
ncbi:HAMP domain-containing protein [Microvirga sp. WGZ8]|uniref:histidine kinase n=2 Tax=Microvirga puerhi TaxID=2876078 RepID=A0ABS7VVK6_9HYPH|nr:ATP-binding protein [Microvirga puerhi]MBZ6079165.1 HAMP domain-containing protein [Microvirga puerhi]